MTARLSRIVLSAGIVALIAALAVLPTGAWSAPRQKPATMVVTFSIQDYASWRPVFDGAAAAREKDGVANGRVYRRADKPNDLAFRFTR